MSLENLAEKLELTLDEFLHEFSPTHGPSLSILKKVADHFEITLDDLLDGRIDHEWVRAPRLSDSYHAEDGSRLRTSIAVLRWIEEKYGQQAAASLTRALRIPVAVLANPDQTVKLRLLASLLQAVTARGVSNESLFEIGACALDITENRGIRDRLAQFKDPRTLLEFFFAEGIEQFESNYDYKLLRMGWNQIEFQVTPIEKRISENGVETMKDWALSAYRCGVSAGLLRSIGVNTARARVVKTTSCGGLPTELIRLAWEKPHATFRDPRLRLVENPSIDS